MSFLKLICFFFCGFSLLCFSSDKPNVLLIVCDDLNDYVETLGGHPQTKTPHIRKLIESGVSFTQAHCNIPICNPSRASFATGIYPHTSQQFGFEDWDKNEILKNSRTMMDHFGENGYHTLGTGKVMHNRDQQEWKELGHPSDYGPFLYDGKERIPNLSVPAPFRDDFGIIDGNFGPLENVTNKKSSITGKKYSWMTGSWRKQRAMKYNSDDDRDPTGDELNAQWAVKRLRELAQSKKQKPFFMGVGFVRPHTPLIVPQKYFDLFPLESIELPKILKADADDTFKHTVTSKEDDRSGDRGTKMLDSLVASYGGDRKLALKKFIQAYLASVASIDDLMGEILEALKDTGLDKNTIVIYSSDQGFYIGDHGWYDKRWMYEESLKMPFIVKWPGVVKAGSRNTDLVQNLDYAQTFLEIAGAPQPKDMQGFSLVPLLKGEAPKDWRKEVYYHYYEYPSVHMIPRHYGIRTKRYKLMHFYQFGNEWEMYDLKTDPDELTNIYGNKKVEKLQKSLTNRLKNLRKHYEDDSDVSVRPDYIELYRKKS